MMVDVRKIVLGVEEVFHDGGPRLARPILKGWVGASRTNHECVNAKRFALFLDASFHGVEPGDACNFHNDYHFWCRCFHTRR